MLIASRPPFPARGLVLTSSPSSSRKLLLSRKGGYHGASAMPHPHEWDPSGRKLESPEDWEKSFVMPLQTGWRSTVPLSCSWISACAARLRGQVPVFPRHQRIKRICRFCAPNFLRSLYGARLHHAGQDTWPTRWRKKLEHGCCPGTFLLLPTSARNAAAARFIAPTASTRPKSR